MTTATHTPKRLLVGLALPHHAADPDASFSKHDHQLIEQVIWYASHAGAELTFAHVLTNDSQEVRDALRECCTNALGQAVQMATDKGITAHTAVLEGISWRQLILAALNNNHDMIAVSPNTQGPRSLMDRLFHGSTARRLLRNCPVPVWIATPATRLPLQKILVPVDFSDVSADTVALATALADSTGAQPIALHCPQYPGDVVARRSVDAHEAMVAYHAEVHQRIDASFDKLLGDQRQRWKTFINDDDIYQALPRLVSAQNIDLVVMGSVARTGLAGFIMGNTAEKILNNLEAAAWVIKPKGWQSPIQ